MPGTHEGNINKLRSTCGISRITEKKEAKDPISTTQPNKNKTQTKMPSKRALEDYSTSAGALIARPGEGRTDGPDDNE